MTARVEVTVYNDPGCPWAYSAVPALRVINWRYGDQISWRLALIGLTEQAEQYLERGYTPVWMSQAYIDFRRWGMPFSTTPRERVVATSRACRAIAAARRVAPGTEWSAFRALQLAWFTTQLLLDEDEAIGAALRTADGLDVDAIVALLDDEAVEADYQRDWAESRTAAGSPAELQGKTAQTDGHVRYTAPSLIASRNGTQVIAGGFQPVEAYDLAIANIDRAIERRDPPSSPHPLLEHFREGLTTQEVAQLLTQGNDAPDRDAAEHALLDLVAAGSASRVDLGDDALWTLNAGA